MYNHRSGRDRVDVVDLDPYGTAAPFIDGAVQAINEGGTSIYGVPFVQRIEALCATRSVVRYLHGYGCPRHY